jgi:O-antigen ligase
VLNRNINNLFFILFAIIPISIIAGSAISLINILLIDFLFLILIIFKKDYSFIKSDVIKYLFILYIYLLFNSFISIDQSVGFSRNFGFLRFIILFVAFNYFFKEKYFLKNVLITWTLILSFILIDIFFESFMGRNLIGFGETGPYQNRVVSFFKDEPIVGGYINAFYLIIIGFLFANFKDQNKKFISIFSIIFLIAIIVTGERSNSIKAFLGLLILYLFMKEYDLKKKISFFISTVFILSVLIFNSQYLKLRFVTQIKSHMSEDQIYFKLYKSGFEVFKNHKLFGVGNKNYRIEACLNKSLDKEKKNIYHCNSHPHQVYFEILSEHGIVGSIFILFILYKIIFSKIIYVLKQQNYIQMGSLIYIIVSFVPFLPSGAFFGDYMLTLFMINIAVFYSSNQKLNIFNQKNL